jgi:chromosome segregation ATPase
MEDINIKGETPMELIKDLDLLVAEGEKIARFAKLFARLPEILTALASADQHVKEVEDIVASKAKDVKALNADIEAKKQDIAELNHALDALNGEVKEVEKEVKKEVAEAKKKAQAKLDDIRLFNDKTIQDSMMTLNKELDRHREMVKKGEAEMNAKLREFDHTIETWAITEREAIAKAERAKKQLADIVAKIGG